MSKYRTADEPDQRALVERALAIAAEAEQRLADEHARIAHLESLSITDDLTGVLNRRGFISQLQRVLASARCYSDVGMPIYCDLDGFKSINDTFGHGAGDRVLCKTAEVLSSAVRDIDVMGRLGGDEIAMALVHSSFQNGSKRVCSIHRLSNKTRVEWLGVELPINASLGAEPYGLHDSEEDLICRADMAMYSVKRRKLSPPYKSAAE